MERGKKPPPRRTASLREVENSYQTEGVRELSIPARHIRVPTVDGGNILSSYMRNIQLPPNLANHGESTTPAQVDKSMYLFHGCGNAIDAQVINSFARWGPSIRFSRPRSYLSPGQAVYWTNSIEFAVAWSFFAEYGHWDLESIQPNRPFRCLVSVSKLDLTRVSFEGGLYLIPAPQTAEDEDQLREWCDCNVASNAGQIQLPPPKSDHPDWGVVGSRIPIHTMQSFKSNIGQQEQTWIFAARNEACSRTLAQATIELIDITFESPPNWCFV